MVFSCKIQFFKNSKLYHFVEIHNNRLQIDFVGIVKLLTYISECVHKVTVAYE